MPEKFSIEPSLEQAFDTLTTEVGERTSSPGAAAAIGAARRRRTTTVLTAAAAVVAIAVGGVVITEGRGDQLSPSDELRELGIPQPAVLDAAAMDSATEGWASTWHVVTREHVSALEAFDFSLGCGESAGLGDVPEPARVGGNLLLDESSQQLAYVMYADFGADSAAADLSRSEMTAQLNNCSGPVTTTQYGDRGAVTTYLPNAPGPLRFFIVARLDNRLALFALTGASVAPNETRARLGEAVLAALQVDETFKVHEALLAEPTAEFTGGVETAHVAPSSSIEPPVETIDTDGLAAALAGWSTWAEAGDIKPAQPLPCLTGPTTSSSGSGASVGTTGELSVYDFDSEQAALQGMQQVLGKLAACSNGPWDLDSTTAPNAVIGSHPDGTVWVVRNGSRVATFTIGGATNPPPGVRLDVAELVRGWL